MPHCSDTFSKGVSLPGRSPHTDAMKPAADRKMLVGKITQ
jgi:hypothetical protein